MKKKGNKKMPTPRHKLIHNPIPTSLFLSRPQCISCSQFNVKMFFLCLMHSQQTNKIQNSNDDKWKNHFYEMKGDVGMSVHEKERKQEDAYTKTQTHSY